MALHGCRIWRPSGLGGAVEVALAAPEERAFPVRTTGALGVCLKHGPSHHVMADGRAREYPADSLCVRLPGCVWSCASTGPVAFESIDIDPSLLPAGLAARPMTFVDPRALPEFARALTALKEPASPLSREEAVAELVLGLDGIIRAEELAEQAPPRAIRQARDLLHARLADPPSLDELSRATGANKFVLLRRFKRIVGVTPHAYLVAIRLDQARELLARGVAAGDVAAALGFSDQAHLTRAFKRSIGITPGHYARQVRASVGVAG